MTEIIRLTPNVMNSHPVLDFPFDKEPDVWVSERTALRVSRRRLPVYVWCYLDRVIDANIHQYNLATLSEHRVAALPNAFRRLSDHFRFKSLSLTTIESSIRGFGQFMSWIDGKEHEGRFEAVLSDANLALQALQLHHRYLKGLMQAHTISRNTCAHRDACALNILSVIHGREYDHEIETIRQITRPGTPAPKRDDVARFSSVLTAVFDSACRVLALNPEAKSDGTWRLSTSTSDDGQFAVLAEGYSRTRLIELAAISFSGLVICDSGSNLAQVAAYEEPDDLWEQLAEPDRVSLTKKVVKLRARGKLVPVTMTALTLSRLRRFCALRSELITILDCPDIAPLFFLCNYKAVKGRSAAVSFGVGGQEPVSIRSIDVGFLSAMRRKCAMVGVSLPNISLKQLRVHKQQELTREVGVRGASEMMGQSITTAVRNYCAAQEGVQASEMGTFLSSLHKTIVLRTQAGSGNVVSIPAGSCASHRYPKASSADAMIEPDCEHTEGCFFCDKFRVHAEERDLRKLLSCRYVMSRLGHLQGGTERADRLYQQVITRIKALAAEIAQFIGFDEFRRVEQNVESGNLTPYWGTKVQQLRLLGLIGTTASDRILEQGTPRG